MAARAIWKGTIHIGKTDVPVKLYSAVEEKKSVHFRLLHEKDLVPVKQRMVNPETGKPVESEEIKKAYPVSKTRLLILEDEDLEELEPEGSRDVEITRFVDPEEIDHRWYERAYYLGPDGKSGAYFALAEALAKKEKEGVAKWVMRKKNYAGALRSVDGYLMLIVLRNADEVVVAEELPRPEGRALAKKELEMAEQLVGALGGEFDPSDYRDDYRARVMELVEAKARGAKPKLKKFRPKAEREESLDKALEASLAGAKRRASGGRRG
ncbi:MAG: Ku protein [Thermoanaerobaculia bacterium]